MRETNRGGETRHPLPILHYIAKNLTTKGPAPLPDNRVELSWVVLSRAVEPGLRLESYDWIVGSYIMKRRRCTTRWSLSVVATKSTTVWLVSVGQWSRGLRNPYDATCPYPGGSGICFTQKNVISQRQIVHLREKAYFFFIESVKSPKLIGFHFGLVNNGRRSSNDNDISLAIMDDS